MEETVVIRQKMTMTEEEFFAFVQTEISKLRKQIAFEAESDITFNDLQEKLEEYTHISFSLTELQARYRWQARSAKKEFDKWFEKKVVEIQQQRNRLDVAGTKWLADKEIERIARVELSDDYYAKLDIVDSIEAREKFVSSLIKDWDKHNYVLSQMCDNIRAEVRSLGMENRLSH